MNDNGPVAWLGRVVSILDRTRRFNEVTNVIAMGIFFLVVCLLFVDILLRYLFNRPLTGVVDVVELTMVIVVFLAVAYTQLRKAHVRIDALVNRLSPKGQVVINSIVGFFSVGIFGVLIWRTAEFVRLSAERGEGTIVLLLPIAPIAWVVTFGCVLLTLVLLRDLLNNLTEGLRLHLGVVLWLLLLGIPILLVAAMVLWLQSSLWVTPGYIMGIVGIVVLLLLFMCGMPVGFALLLVGFLGTACIRGLDSGLDMSGTVLYRSTATYSWAPIAFFVLMGYFIFYSGIGRDLYYAAYQCFGQLSGGLAVATIAAATALAATIGSTLPATVTLGAIALPEMKRYKYADSLSTGAICAGGTLSPMIPPSVGFIMYAVLTEQSIGDLFIAGIMPGLLISASFIVYIFVRCRLNPGIGPQGPSTSFVEKLVSLRNTWPIVILFLLVIGGIYGGIFTPSEGGAIGAVGALLTGLALRRFTRQGFIRSLLDAGRVVAMSYIIIGGSMIFSYFLAVSKLPVILAELILGVPGVAIVIGMIVVLIILGSVLPFIPVLLIVIPIFYSVIVALGYDPIWFGVITMLMLETGALTPPFGINVFALKGVAPDIPIGTIFRGSVPFVVLLIACTALVVAFPQIATWLPYLRKG